MATAAHGRRRHDGGHGRRTSRRAGSTARLRMSSTIRGLTWGAGKVLRAIVASSPQGKNPHLPAVPGPPPVAGAFLGRAEPSGSLRAPAKEVAALLGARRSPHRRRSHRATVGVLLATLVFPFAGLSAITPTIAHASPGQATNLERKLDQLNADADQLVEDYLQAKLELDRVQASMRPLLARARAADAQLAPVRARIAARATAAYVHGPGIDVISVLGSGDAMQALERMQTLDLLAERDIELYSQATAIERTARDRAAALRAVEQRRVAKVADLAARKTRIERLAAETRRVLAQVQAADRRRGQPSATGTASTSAPAAPAPPAGVSGRIGRVIRYAYAQLGKPYQWGADGPGSFDCSGLTMMAWAQAGVALPHSSRAQIGVGRRVSRSELAPGDLIFRNSPISHVALYIGGGNQIAATHTGSTVKLQSAFGGDIVGYSRPIG
jgi:peptidoglycan DL-endopeptidase CwlO